MCMSRDFVTYYAATCVDRTLYYTIRFINQWKIIFMVLLSDNCQLLSLCRMLIHNWRNWKESAVCGGNLCNNKKYDEMKSRHVLHMSGFHFIVFFIISPCKFFFYEDISPLSNIVWIIYEMWPYTWDMPFSLLDFLRSKFFFSHPYKNYFNFESHKSYFFQFRYSTVP